MTFAKGQTVEVFSKDHWMRATMAQDGPIRISDTISRCRVYVGSKDTSEWFNATDVRKPEGQLI
jgi:hypothetical protein